MGDPPPQESREIVCIALDVAIDMSASRDEAEVRFEFVPPSGSVAYLQAYLQARQQAGAPSGVAETAADALRKAARAGDDGGGGGVFPT